MADRKSELKLYVADWDSYDYEEQFMVCVARNREEAMEKFKAKWDAIKYSMDKDSKFVDEIEMESYETIETYVTEHDVNETVRTTHEG